MALLPMARHERRDGPDAGRGTEKDALLAAELLALALSKRRNIDVPQSRPNSLDHAVDAAGQDVEKIRAAIERHGNRRTQAMETIRTMLTAEVAEFKRELGIG